MKPLFYTMASLVMIMGAALGFFFAAIPGLALGVFCAALLNLIWVVLANS